MIKTNINVGYLLSYDYEYIFNSLNEIYKYVDQIVLAIDINYKTWNGNEFSIEQQFFTNIKNLDTRNIIEFFYDEFYIEKLTPIECEFRERNLLLNHLNKGWKIQLDVDEYFFDFDILVKSLKANWLFTKLPSFFPVVISINWITLFKKTDKGFVYINSHENTPLITNTSNNTYSRENKYAHKIFSNNYAIHQSWARSEVEIKMKINNWGHVTDFNTSDFFEFWSNIDDFNFGGVRDFHPLEPKVWSCMEFIEAKNIKEFAIKINGKIVQNKKIFIFKDYGFALLIASNSAIRNFKQVMKKIALRVLISLRILKR